MAFDIEMLKQHYDSMAERVENAKLKLGRPLTLTEKILFTHLHQESP